MINPIVDGFLNFIIDIVSKLYVILFPLVDKFITGDFKWTFLGAILVIFGFTFAEVINNWIKPTWAKVLVTVVMIGLFVWFGHLWVDPWFHKIASWYTTPLGEPMKIIVRPENKIFIPVIIK